MQHLRVTFGHVRQCELGYGKHLQDIGPEQRLDLVQINLLEVLAHELLGSIVDQNCYGRSPDRRNATGLTFGHATQQPCDRSHCP